MNKHIFKSLIFSLLMISCNNEIKKTKTSSINDVKSKLISITKKIINQKDNSDTKVLITELSNN